MHEGNKIFAENATIRQLEWAGQLQPVMGSKFKFFCLLVRDDHQKKLHKINYTVVKTHKLFSVVVLVLFNKNILDSLR